MSEYIERDKTIKALEEIINTSPMLYVEGLTIAYNYVRSAPSADVAPVKRGKWILQAEGVVSEEKYWECSLCGCGSDSFDTVYHTPYCPNCGARMDDASAIIEAEEVSE